VKCELCGFEFAESEASRACSGCSALGGCGLIRCPNCGYEWPKEPAWMTRLTNWLKGKKRDAS
jgi:rubredoxin